MNFFVIGLRNILKNRRRSLLTIAALAFGFSSITVFLGYIHKVYDFLGEQAVHGERLGHLIIMRKGLLKEGKIDPAKYVLSDKDVVDLTRIIKEQPEVTFVAPRLNISGLFSNGKVSTIFIGEGVHPDDLRALRGDFRLDRGGVLDPKQAIGVAVSSELSEMIAMGKGSSGTLVTNTLTGQANATDVDVQDIFNTGNAGTNDKFVIMPLTMAQNLLDTTGADRLTVLLNSSEATEPVLNRLTERLRDYPVPLEIKTWVELSSFYLQVRNMFNMIFGFMFAIVAFIVTMSVINTMSMTVMERTREIGTLRALGMKRRSILALFSTEAVLLALTGGVIGALFTVIIAFLVNHSGLSYVPPNSSDTVLLLVDIVPLLSGLAFVFVALLAGVAAIFPARRAAQAPIVDALGHT